MIIKVMTASVLLQAHELQLATNLQCIHAQAGYRNSSELSLLRSRYLQEIAQQYPEWRQRIANAYKIQVEAAQQQQQQQEQEQYQYERQQQHHHGSAIADAQTLAKMSRLEAEITSLKEQLSQQKHPQLISKAEENTTSMAPTSPSSQRSLTDKLNFDTTSQERSEGHTLTTTDPHVERCDATRLDDSKEYEDAKRISTKHMERSNATRLDQGDAYASAQHQLTNQTSTAPSEQSSASHKKEKVQQEHDQTIHYPVTSIPPEMQHQGPISTQQADDVTKLLPMSQPMLSENQRQ